MPASDTLFIGPLPAFAPEPLPEKPYFTEEIALHWNLDTLSAVSGPEWAPSFLSDGNPAPPPQSLPVYPEFPYTSIVMGAIILFMGLAAINKHLRPWSVKAFFRSFSGIGSFRRFLDEEEPGWLPVPGLMYIGATLPPAMLIFEALHETLEQYVSHALIALAVPMVLCLVIPVLKSSLIALLGKIYRMPQAAKCHAQLLYQSQFIWGVLVALGWTLVTYVQGINIDNIQILLYSGFSALLILLLRMCAIAIRERGFPLLYFLLYLCTLEILPLAWIFLRMERF